MSSIYNLEPPTKGKVILKTTLGDIEVELWPKEAPKAVRNFVQLCLEGYYNGTIFHRVIKNFMVQGGDPSGTGTGGESIYGDAFKDEFHSRIKFNHRGLVACANENKPHTNGSQFFITLEACPHLDRKHTIFGKVVGDSIYNVAHFNELHTDDTDRPMEPPVFLDAEVVWNPFDDIVPRSTKEEREAEAAAKRAREAEEQRKAKKKQKKNLGLLSFGEEAGEEEQEVAALATKVGSAFDVARGDDPRLLKSGTEAAERLKQIEEAEEAERRRVKASVKASLTKAEDEGADAERLDSGRSAGPSGDEGENDDFTAKMRKQALARRLTHGKPLKAEVKEEEEEDDASKKKAAPTRKEPRDRQSEALAAGKVVQARMKPSKLLAGQDTELMSDFEKRRIAAKQRSRLAKEQGNNLAKLMAFKKRLGSGAAPPAQSAEQETAKEDDEGYDGKVRKGDDPSLPAAWRIDRFLDDYEDEKLDTLVHHKLKFNKETAKKDAMAANFDDNYVVQDPLLDRKEKWNRKEGAAKRSQREWAAGQEGPLD